MITFFKKMNKLVNSNPRYFLHNGRLKTISEFSGNIISGEKVIYEVIKISDSAPIFLDEHLSRMRLSIELSKLKKIDLNSLRKSIKELLHINPVQQQNIKLIASYKAENAQPNITVFFIPSKYPSVEDKLNGVYVKTITAIRNNPGIKAENKTLRTYADEVIAKNLCYEVLMINETGQITEGSRSNVFFVANTKLYTAPLNLVLGGITRLKVMDICNKLNIDTVQECLNEKQLPDIDGAFITGTSPGVLAINKIDDIELNVNIDLIKQISKEYDTLVQNEINRWKSI